MSQYSSVNAKLLDSATKNETGVPSRVSSNMISDSKDETAKLAETANFLHELLLTNREVKNICKAFGNSLSTNTELSKTQIFKIIESVGFLCKLLGPLMKVDLGLMKNVIKPFAKRFLIPLGLRRRSS